MQECLQILQLVLKASKEEPKFAREFVEVHKGFFISLFERGEFYEDFDLALASSELLLKLVEACQNMECLVEFMSEWPTALIDRVSEYYPSPVKDGLSLVLDIIDEKERAVMTPELKEFIIETSEMMKKLASIQSKIEEENDEEG